MSDKLSSNHLKYNNYMMVSNLSNEIIEGQFDPTDYNLKKQYGEITGDIELDISKIPNDIFFRLFTDEKYKNSFDRIIKCNLRGIGIEEFKKKIKKVYDNLIIRLEHPLFSSYIANFISNIKKNQNDYSAEQIEAIVSVLIKEPIEEFPLNLIELLIYDAFNRRFGGVLPLYKEDRKLKLEKCLDYFKENGLGKNNICYSIVLFSYLRNNAFMNEFNLSFFLDYISHNLYQWPETIKSSKEKLEFYERFNSLKSNIQMDNNYCYIPSNEEEKEIINDYLTHFFIIENMDIKDVNINGELNEDYLKRFHAFCSLDRGETEIKYINFLSESEIQKAKNDIIFEPQKYNKEDFAIDEDVELEFHMKNVEKFLVRGFQLDSMNYFKDRMKPFALEECSEEFLEPLFEYMSYINQEDIKKISYKRMKFDIPKHRGIYIIELIGGGACIKVSIQRGGLFLASKNNSDYKEFYIIDEIGNICKYDTGLYIDNKFYKANENTGLIKVTCSPFSTPLLYSIDFASVPRFPHLYSFQHDGNCRKFSLETLMIFSPENLGSRKLAKFFLRVFVLRNGEKRSVRDIEESKLIVRLIKGNEDKINNNSNDEIKSNVMRMHVNGNDNLITKDNVNNDDDIIGNEEIYENEDRIVIDKPRLYDDRELEVCFQIPEDTKKIEFIFEGTIYNEKHEPIKLNSSKLFILSPISLYTSYLSQNTLGEYIVEVIDNDGMPKKNYGVNVILGFKQRKEEKKVYMKTNKNGYFNLGRLESVEYVKIGDKIFEMNGNKNIYLENQWINQSSYIKIPFLNEDKVSLTKICDNKPLPIQSCTEKLEVKITDQKNKIGFIGLNFLDDGKYNMQIGKKTFDFFIDNISPMLDNHKFSFNDVEIIQFNSIIPNISLVKVEILPITFFVNMKLNCVNLSKRPRVYIIPLNRYPEKSYSFSEEFENLDFFVSKKRINVVPKMLEGVQQIVTTNFGEGEIDALNRYNKRKALYEKLRQTKSNKKLRKNKSKEICTTPTRKEIKKAMSPLLRKLKKSIEKDVKYYCDMKNNEEEKNNSKDKVNCSSKKENKNTNNLRSLNTSQNKSLSSLNSIHGGKYETVRGYILKYKLNNLRKDPKFNEQFIKKNKDEIFESKIKPVNIYSTAYTDEDLSFKNTPVKTKSNKENKNEDRKKLTFKSYIFSNPYNEKIRFPISRTNSKNKIETKDKIDNKPIKIIRNDFMKSFGLVDGPLFPNRNGEIFYQESISGFSYLKIICIDEDTCSEFVVPIISSCLSNQ